jgi:hypothetical protein
MSGTGAFIERINEKLFTYTYDRNEIWREERRAKEHLDVQWHLIKLKNVKLTAFTFALEGWSPKSAEMFAS